MGGMSTNYTLDQFIEGLKGERKDKYDGKHVVSFDFLKKLIIAVIDDYHSCEHLSMEEFQHKYKCTLHEAKLAVALLSDNK